MQLPRPEVAGDLEGQQNVVNQASGEHLAADTDLTLEQFRVLVGIPQEMLTEPKDGTNAGSGNKQTGTNRPSGASGGKKSSPIKPATIRTTANTKPRALIFLRLLSRPPHARRAKNADLLRLESQLPGTTAQDEYASSIFFSLIREESDQWRLYHIYNVITYACLILQLVIASALIIIGAIPESTSGSQQDDSHAANRISVAILGAVTGLLTGVLSLLKGQGLPTRFLQYASRLRQVRERIEFMERTLRANITGTVITYQDVLDIWHTYENVLNERDMNKPDAWAPATTLSNPTDPGLNRVRQHQPSKQRPSAVQEPK